MDATTALETGLQTVTSVAHEDRRYVLSCPISVEVAYREGMVWWECPSLEIWACGATSGDARRAFAAEFARIYDYYANEPNDRLTDGAQELKHLLTEVVARVDEGTP